jgi:hypothetical protein
MTLAQLMDERHAAYVAASAKGFSGSCLELWRSANRDYVLARHRKALMTPEKGGIGVARTTLVGGEPLYPAQPAKSISRHLPSAGGLKN